MMSQGRPVFPDLASLFDPRAVAVIGASGNPGKLGFHVMKSLTSGGFKGAILPVNPGSGSVMGIPTRQRSARALASLWQYKKIMDEVADGSG